jgi:hypothetical protein
VRSAGNLDPS